MIWNYLKRQIDGGLARACWEDLIASYMELGRSKKAKSEAKKFLGLYPKYSMAKRRKFMKGFHKDTSFLERRFALLREAGLPLMPSASHIVPLLVGDPRRCRHISDALMLEHAIYLQPINYPTVPKGTERLRITPSPVHADGDFDQLIDALIAIWARFEMRRAA